MRIILPIKQVPETRKVRMDEETGTVIREGVESIVNPLDLYSIEFALKIKDQIDCEIIGISMGPPKAESALKESISMGIDSGILVTDKVFGGSDTWATSYVLYKAIEKIGHFDLIICGERATDGDTGQVGPGIAAFMGLPVVTYVSGLNDINKYSCSIDRMVEHGHETLNCQYPLVLTVVKEIGEPRLPTLRGKQRAKKTAIQNWGHKDLGIDPDKVGLKGSPTRVVKIFKPQVARECKMLYASDDTQLETAVDQLAKDIRNMELY